MAAKTLPTSPWVSSYSDKTDEWVKARLEHFVEKEKLSVAGSIPRRKEIRQLRVELLNRAALAAAAEAAQLPPDASAGPALASPGQLVA